MKKIAKSDKYHQEPNDGIVCMNRIEHFYLKSLNSFLRFKYIITHGFLFWCVYKQKTHKITWNL